MSLRPFDEHAKLRRGLTLLEASAGTGKTYQITSLVLRLVVEQGIDLRSIAVVTFTRAATAELRDRVRKRLATAAQAFVEPGRGSDDSTVSALLASARSEGSVSRAQARLEEALASFDQISISTIHGFCQRALATHAFESGAAFGEELVQDQRPLLEAVVDDFLSAELNTAPRDRFVRWSRSTCFGRDALLALAHQAIDDPELEVQPSARVDAEARRAQFAALRDTVVTHRADIVRAYVEARAKGAPLFRNRTWTDENLSEALDALVDALSRAAELDAHWQDVLSGQDLAWFEPSTRKNEKYEAFELPEALREVIDRMRELDDDVALARARFVAFARREVARRHEQAGTQSFNDLVRRLARALEDPRRAPTLTAAMAERFEAVLIDEFQDTDAAQWSIFRRCFGQGRHFAFLIGDPKQAIYGFRGANVHVYLQARAQAQAGAFTMGRNYRSDGGYVAAMNVLFGADEAHARTVFGGAADGSGIVYTPVTWPETRTPAARLRWTGASEREGGDAPAPLSLRLCGEDFGAPGSTGRLGKAELQRSLCPRVGEDIVALLHGGAERWDDELCTWRPLGPGDVAVLVRNKHQASDIQAALSERAVPSVIAGAGSVLESEEARALELWLIAVAAPGNDRAARAAAITPVWGWTGDELASVEAEDPAAETRWARWLESLAEARATFADRGFMASLRRCMERFDAARRLLGLEGGARRLTNLLHVAELVHAAVTAQRLRLAGTIRWLADRRAELDLEQEAAELRLEGDEAAVRIVTIHASKGLQYPVVFVPFAWADDPSPSGKKPLVVPSAHDPVERVLDLHTNPRHPDRVAAVVRQRAESLTESIRLLYVALTRAQMCCVLYDAYAEALPHSPLATVLHAGDDWRDGLDRMVAASERAASLGPTELLGDLRRVEAEAGGHVDVKVCAPVDACTRLSLPGPPPSSLSVRAFERLGLDLMWRRSSFTAMVSHGTRRRGAEPDAALEGVDHDAIVEGEAVGRSAHLVELPTPPRQIDVAGDAEPPLAAFPAGAREGTYLHAVYEHADFAALAPGEDGRGKAEARAGLEASVRDLATLHGIDLSGADPRGRPWHEVVPEAIERTLHTPLGGPLADWRLCDLGRETRLDELRFDLPLAGGSRFRARLGPAAGRARHAQMPVRDHAFVDALLLAGDDGASEGLRPSYRRALESLAFGRLAGFLTGSIDLVFATPDPERAGRRRWWIADYKSNRLDLRREGNVGIDNFCPDWMTVEMEHHHYFVQLHLYTLALHRYLKHRLEDYEYEKDVGGAYYLFVRGMVGVDTPRDAAGRTYGALHFRPAGAVIQALDALFEGRGSAT